MSRAPRLQRCCHVRGASGPPATDALVADREGCPTPLVDAYETRVSLADTDASQCVSWSAPLRWATIGYHNLAEAAGHPIAETLEGDHYHPVVHVSVDYSRPLRLGDSIRVATSIARVGRTSFAVESVVYEANGETAVVIRRTQVTVARGGGPIPVDGWLRNLAVER